MPYFRVSVTQKLSPEKKQELAEGLGIALETVPGKERFMLMADIEDGKSVFVGGRPAENYAFADIHYYGAYSYQIKSKLTKEVFAVFSRVLGVEPPFASLTITEHHSWGGFGDYRDEYYTED